MADSVMRGESTESILRCFWPENRKDTLLEVVGDEKEEFHVDSF